MRTRTRELSRPTFWVGLIGLAVGLFLALVLATIQPAQAMMACGERTIIVDRLAAKFDEHRASLMIDNQGNLVEIFSNRVTGSWTLLITRPGGSTCVVSSGQDYTSTLASRATGPQV